MARHFNPYRKVEEMPKLWYTQRSGDSQIRD